MNQITFSTCLIGVRFDWSNDVRKPRGTGAKRGGVFVGKTRVRERTMK